jgi:oligopeptide/dipeptide ABC transporter ATP-binding protein
MDAMARSALVSVGLPDPDRVLKGHAHELSGGMAQRVVIAIALLLDPKLLIGDEPTTALDVTLQRQILDLIRTRVIEDHRSMLLVTHDLGVVAQYCDRVVVMYAGKVVERGAVRTVLAEPAHPYTQALLRSVPRRGETIRALPGRVPDLASYPEGCPFADRCPSVMDRCRTSAPELSVLSEAGSDRRAVSCHLVEESKGHRATRTG